MEYSLEYPFENYEDGSKNAAPEYNWEIILADTPSLDVQETLEQLLR